MYEGWDTDLWLRVAYLAAAIPFTIIRLLANKRCGQVTSKKDFLENALVRRGIRVFETLGGLGMVAWVIQPQSMQWSALEISEPVRWLGVAFIFLGTLFTWWVHETLGDNFSPFLHVRKGHELITTGPYGFVRHPMYTGLFMVLIGTFLITTNIFIFLTTAGVLAVLLVYRIPREERVLMDAFPNEYDGYANNRPRFIPGF